MKDPKSKLAVIIGCGRLGSYIANSLSPAGHDVVVVDNREEAFEALSSEFSGFSIEGDATEFDVLKQAHTDRADFFVSATASDDVNLMAAQIAKKVFGVARAIARIHNTEKHSLCRDMGIETVNPTKLVGDIVIRSLQVFDET